MPVDLRYAQALPPVPRTQTTTTLVESSEVREAGDDEIGGPTTEENDN